jgi:protein TonB
MEKSEKFIKKPTYPGGSKAMDAFIKENMQYPQKALDAKISGTVAVVIDIDENGFVKKGRIKKSIGFGCDEEAVRLCKLLKFSTAAKRKSRKTTFHRTINIHFRLKEVRKMVTKKVPNKPQTATQVSAPIHTASSTASGPLRVNYAFVPKKKKD